MVSATELAQFDALSPTPAAASSTDGSSSASSSGLSSSHGRRHAPTPSSAPLLPSASTPVGQVLDADVHASGTTAAYESMNKWIDAALQLRHATTTDLIDADGEPNDALAAATVQTVADWYLRETTARDAGVVHDSDHLLDRPPPEECVTKTMAQLTVLINTLRCHRPVPMRVVHPRWARDLPGVRAAAARVKAAARARKKESGRRYHHKHDFAPTPEQLTAMMRTGWTGDARVHAHLLDAVEAGMSLALYLPTGARGGELKQIQIQSLGYESIPHRDSGHTFACLKLTAFDTKTKEHHLNQLLADVNPWDCGIGLLGHSILVRVRLHGPPPFRMQCDERSWRILGTSSTTLDARLKEAFAVAGMRRQLGDTVGNLGRHHGTRTLQHAGGSAEGGAARTGHSSKDARSHYTETPLPDLLRVAKNDPEAPFVPEHLSAPVSLTDAVVDALFPDLAREATALDARQREVDALPRSQMDRTRTAEQLNDRERLVRALRFACRTAVCCWVGRPRTWQKRTILADAKSLWEEYLDDPASQRALAVLLKDCPCAVRAVTALHAAVRAAEDATLSAIVLASGVPTAARIAAADSSALPTQDVVTRRDLEVAMARQEQAIELAVRRALSPASSDADPPRAHADQNADAARARAHDAARRAAIGAGPAVPVRVKHPRREQTDVRPLSSWDSVADALAYAQSELLPLERAQGAAWRILRLEGHTSTHKREDKSRDYHWKNYTALATAVGARMRDAGLTRDAALARVQSERDAIGSHRLWERGLRAEKQASATEWSALAHRAWNG